VETYTKPYFYASFFARVDLPDPINKNTFSCVNLQNKLFELSILPGGPITRIRALLFGPFGLILNSKRRFQNGK